MSHTMERSRAIVSFAAITFSHSLIGWIVVAFIGALILTLILRAFTGRHAHW